MLASSTARSALLVVAVATAVRIFVAIDAQDAPFWSVPVVDEVTYLRLAESMVNGVAPPHGAYYVAPGYAYFLAGVLKAGGQVPFVKALQLILGVANSLLIFLLARRYFSRPVAVAAALLWCLHPVALLHELLLLKPTITVFLALLGLVLTGGRTWVHWAGVGLAFGAAALFRGEMLVVGACLLTAGVGARLRGWPGAPSWPSTVAGALALAAVVALPTVQNLANGGGPVIIAFGGGSNFYIGNNPRADGSYIPLRPDRSDALFEANDAVALARQGAGQPLNASAVSRWWTLQGLNWWKEQPADAIVLTLKKSLLVWGWWEGNDVMSANIASRWVAALKLRVVRAGWILPLALVGVFVLRARRELWPLWVFLVATHLALVPFFMFERFRLPLTAVALPLAVAALHWIFVQARANRIGPTLAGLGAALALVLGLALPSVSRNEQILRVNVGGMLLQQGRFQEALDEFMIVRREAPEAKRIEINLANTYMQLGRNDEALRSLRTALQYLYAEGQATGQPAVEEIVYCHELAGDLQHSTGQGVLAAKQYEQALRYQPQNARLRQKLSAVRGRP